MAKQQPKYRFSGFNEPWRVERLDKNVKWASGGTPSKTTPSYWNGCIPWITASEMHGFEYSNSRLKISHDALIKGAKMAEVGDLLLLVRGSMLFNRIPVGIVKSRVSFNQDVKAIKCNGSILPRFLLSWFQAKEHELLNLVVGTGIGAGKLDLQDLKSIKLFFPELAEQQKISEFFTSVDEKIKQLSKKNSLLERYKNGVMQQIFSQEIRFKDENINDYPEWNDKKLCDLAISIANGLSLQQNSTRDGVKVTRIETISEKRINLNKVGYVLTSQDIAPYKLKIGDLLLSNINSVAHIGKVVHIDKDYDLYHGMNLLRLRFDLTVTDAKYFYYLLGSKEYKNHFEMICNKAVNQASINQTQLGKTIVKTPSLGEQRKISNFLSAIDDKINHVTKQLEQTKQYKKGLLQQMFV